MTVIEIVKQHLLANGFDGLYNEDAGCACLARDLMPCDEPGTNCNSGYRAPCECGEGCKFHIVPEKKTPKDED